MLKKLRIGYSAAVLAGLCLLGAIPQIIDWLVGKGPHINPFRAVVVLIMVIAAVAGCWTATKIHRRVALWRAALEARPIPRFTVLRVIVLVGVVGGECFAFFRLSVYEKYSWPLLVLLVCGLIISLNFLENSWVAIDRRQGRAARPSRTRFV